MRRMWMIAVAGASLVACVSQVDAQAARAPQSTPLPNQRSYTLRADAREVLTDITVTDAAGNPVHGLERSQFKIFDDGHSERISSFEEHSASASAVGGTNPLAAHTFNNDFLLHPPAAFNVLMLDTATISVVDQMYLNEELTHFIKALPASQLLSIYARAGELTVPLQDFTTDHALLLAALNQAIPHLRQPGATQYEALGGLQQLAQYLSHYPGRKNVMWFGGNEGSLFLADSQAIEMGEDRALYDQLNAARISVYPIDARGLTTNSYAVFQHMPMEQEAEATGGHAYFDTNGLANVAAEIVKTGENFYTLVYSPNDLKLDTKWHHVKVTVAGGEYQLSYRRGYYDDGMIARPSEAKPRTMLRAHGETTRIPANVGEPIVFSVVAQPSSSFTTSVMPASTDVVTPPEDESQPTYTFRYTIPAADLSLDNVPEGKRVRVGAGILVFNEFGRMMSKTSQEFTLTFDGDKLTANPHGTLTFDQRSNLPKGQDHLLLAVWDMETGRMGTIKLSVKVASHPKT